MNSLLLIIGTLIGISYGQRVKIKSDEFGYYLYCQGGNVVGRFNQGTVFQLERRSGFTAFKGPDGKYISAQPGLSYHEYIDTHL